MPGDVVVDGVVPPRVEHLVVVGAEQVVVEPQTEAGAAQSIGPDLGVLAMDADRAFPPLVGEVAGDSRVSPGEGVLAVPDNVEWLVPAVVAGDVAVQTEQ